MISSDMKIFQILFTEGYFHEGVSVPEHVWNREEEDDDEEYWEPYLEALEELDGEIRRYVHYASDQYAGIVNCISLWQNVAEDVTSHTLSYVVNKVHKFTMDAYRIIFGNEMLIMFGKTYPAKPAISWKTSTLKIVIMKDG